jgi:hypothetical protein
MRSCVSGLCCRSIPAGPDGIRERHPNKSAACCCHRYKRIASLVGSTDGHLLLALEPLASARGSGGDRLTPIRFAARHHGPDDPGHLVGQSDRGELARFTLQQLQKPRRGGFAARFGEADDGHSADEQQLTQPFIACFADFAQALLAAGGMFLRCQTQPRGEVSRAETKFPGSTVKAIVIAPHGPMPGISANNWLTGLTLCSAASSPSTAVTR